MADQKVKVFDGSAWQDIESSGATDVCSLTDVDCSALQNGRIIVYADGSAPDGSPSEDPSFVFQDIGASSIGRPPMGSDWETNTIGWKFTNSGNLLMGTSISNSSEGPADPDEPSERSDWPEGSIGSEIDSLRVLFEEGGGGSTPSLPPGENAGEQYSERRWSEDAGIANDEYIFARDGVFSNGRDWSVDGLTWARAPRTVNFSTTKSMPPVKLTSQGTLYISSDGTAFSYDMKSWYAITQWITGNSSYGLRPLSSVFICGDSAYVYARFRSSYDSTDSSAWRLRLLKFNPASGGFAQVLAGSSTREDNLLAFFADYEDIRAGNFATFTTHESGGYVLGLQTGGTRVTRINSQGVVSENNALDARLPVESFTYDGTGHHICAKLDDGTALSSDGTVFSSTSRFPQAGNYSSPYFDGVGRWHICGPAGQPLICYANATGTVINWQLVNQEVPSGGDGEAYTIAAGGRVIITQRLSGDYLLSGQVDGVYTVDVKLTQTSGSIFSLSSPRLIIDDAETQEDANQIFVDRFQNTGNLLLGSQDSGGVWAAGTIGKALEDISKAEGPAGPAGSDGKGWTGGSYNASNGIVTFTSADGLGFATEDLRGAKGADGIGTKGDDGEDGLGWTGGSYSSSTGVVTFTSDDGLGFTTGDLRGAKGDDGVGTNGEDGEDGTSVDLTTVSVNTADCSVTPESSSGSFVADADGADGTKQYKLDLQLPRGTVVTESSTQPDSTGLCVGDLWIDPTEGDDTGGGDGTIPIQSGGRLTLEAGVPVMAGDVVSSVLYYTPYSGDTFSVYDPDQSTWVARRFSELSLDVSSLAANKVHDIFISNDSDSWVLTPSVWTDDKTRATPLSRLDGVLVSGASNTQRFIGTIRTNGSGQVESKKINRCLWNAYNQVFLTIEARWFNVFAYSGTAWIPYANSIINGEARVSCVLGSATNVSMISPCMAKYGYTGIVLGRLSDSWNGGEYTGTPGHSGHLDGATTTTTIDSKVAAAGYNFVQGVISGINGNSLFRDLTIQGNYYG